MSLTGRRIGAPAFDLVEVIAANGLKHIAMSHRETWHGHPLISADLQAKLGFMEQPDVSGVCRLVSHEPETGVFVYPTGTVWPIAEIVGTFAENGTAPGVKAGLELCYLVAETLVESAEAAAAHGIGGHGNVNPWTLLLKGDGQPMVLGYGVPQVELLAWREDNRLALTEDSFRYAPPERIDGAFQDVSSDLFALALVSLEVMVGRPVYDGVLADVKQQASRGEGMRRLYQWRERLPQNVREVLGRALKPDPDTRFPNALELVYAVHDLLGSIDVEGPSLAEVMTKIRASQKRGKALKGGQTKLLTQEEMAEMAADLADAEDRPIKPPRRPRPDGADEASGAHTPGDKPRWSKPSRGAAAGPAAPQPSEASGASDRPRRRTDATPIAGASAPSSARGAVGAQTETSGAGRRRVRPQPPPELPAEVDLNGPDDVELELATGGQPAPAPSTMAVPLNAPPTAAPTQNPPPSVGASPRGAPEPASDDTGVRRSAAAALLEKLRTSGDRRRRVRAEGDPQTGLVVAPPPAEPGRKPASAPSTASGPSGASGSGPSGPSTPVQRAPPADPPPRPRPPTGQVPTSTGTPVPGTRAVAPPPPPSGLSGRSVSPQTATKTLGDAGPPRRMIEVAWGGRRVQLPWRTGERAASLALRATLAMGGFPVDPMGRLLGCLRLHLPSEAPPAPGAIVPPDAAVEAIAYELVAVPAEFRRIEVAVKVEPPIRFETLVCTAIPVGWAVAGLARLAALPPGDWAMITDAGPVDGDVLLVDVLGASNTIVVGAARPS